MKRIVAATLGLGLVASSASAQNRNMKGSDTLFDVTNKMLELCQISANNLIYSGGGSTGGETNLKNGTQQISPMSRFLNSAACGSAASPALGQGYAFALDGIGVFSDDTEATTCGTLRHSGVLTVDASANGDPALDCPDCTNTTATSGDYAFTEWQQVLRIVYAGRHNVINADPCADNQPSAPSGETANCNSDVRNALVNNWSNLFEGGCTDPECTSLKHAFRRDDISGTTDTFLTLLSLPGVGSAPFCNGTEFEDKDPIRRECDGNGQSTGGENVCRRTNFKKETVAGSNATPAAPDWAAVTAGSPSSPNAPNANNKGDLGLVLPIVMPLTLADQYANDNPCSALGIGGQFKFAAMPASLLPAAQQLCPNGTPRAFAKCLWPVDSAGNFGCVNAAANVPVGVSGFASKMDGRVYNLTVRRADGTIPTVSRASGTSTVQRPLLNVGFYRIHQRTLMANASGTPCKQPDDTEQIGCLVRASPCSIGYAGLAADLQPSNKPLNLLSPLSVANGGLAVGPSTANVRRLLESCTAGDYDIRYPLSRKLFLNTLIGFANVVDNPTISGTPTTTQERQLARCWSDRRFIDRASLQFGFIPLDDATCSTQTLPSPTASDLGTPAECALDDNPGYEIKDCAGN